MLNKLTDFGDSITLVPQSGIQFVEYGFDLGKTKNFQRSFIERPVPATEDIEGRMRFQLLPNWDDAEPDVEGPHRPEAKDEEYPVTKKDALDIFLNRWVPVPFFRIKPGRDAFGNETFDDGPTDWVRAKLVETRLAHDDAESSHRVIFAFDTTLVDQRHGGPYLGISTTDARRPESFRFVHRLKDIGAFLSNRSEPQEPERPSVDAQAWLTQWLEIIFREAKIAKYPNRQLTDEDFPYHLQHVALYITFVAFLAETVRPAKITLVDTVSAEPRVAPIDVDLVLDVGNSRTCGLLIQSFPNDPGVDLNRSLVLELRDLGNPVLSYHDPFESHLELVHAEFGREDLAKKSGRNRAFFWPSLVRLGPEASRYRTEAEGTEAMTGMSSPKRYLWDVEPMTQSWRFRNESGPTADFQPLIERSIYRHVNNRGDVLEQLVVDKRLFRLKIRAEDMESAESLRFSRSSFFTFMLLELIAQALMMINSPAARRRDREKDSPRRLRSIVMTIPSATPVQEQRIIRSRTEAAIRLLWALMGWTKGTPGVPPAPEVHTSWDEASSVHLVYLYGEITQKLGGNMAMLLDSLGKSRQRTDHEGRVTHAAPQRSLRIASVDIGGGTTDLMVTTYHELDNRALVPVQNFREGFRRAGDDLVKLVVERVVLPAIEKHLAACGLRDARSVLRDRFSEDSPGMSEADKHLRRQFVLGMLRPVALGILEAAEERSGSHETLKRQTFGDFFAERGIRLGGNGRLLDYLQDFAQRLGAPGFALADVPIVFGNAAINGCIRACFETIFANISEAIYKLDADVVLLTGRPSCLPGVVSLFANQHGVPIDRIVPIRDYRVGNWYPFRRPAQSLIDDPKTTAVVGGMLCSLASGQLTNFTLLTGGMAMRSTARYIGEMRQDGMIADDKLYFEDVDFDAATPSPMEKEVLVYTAVRIGFRQLARQDWVAAPLYRLRLAPGEHRSISRPIRVQIERKSLELDEDPSDIAIMNSEATSEEFVVAYAEDDKGRMVTRLVELKFDTSSAGADGIYWLDSGILTIA